VILENEQTEWLSNIQGAPYIHVGFDPVVGGGLLESQWQYRMDGGRLIVIL
jgi:hypothetical protein